ncbi:cob(I)yrinic acid a c-diamide adenosyltransferase [Devosia sp. Root413D1]|uniref:cob(I)yrinic acid a,c-diamide adenosyltransferase n=1 Tax=Devosia sp. Root413D1 TaxID=1736531 RepID=UPI0006FB34C4|nr:cob(I)yrinic acid a,c-diamide adenosyltransferase [Devosia sp. Root413D1]KQW74894.1 cob(I)yrinic acid a c-diamide adenosyltransferase [Devosia sp. Root413D1]
MVKLNKIYTKTGDDGTTGLVRGPRRSKADLRVECFGTVDEANSFIGMARLHTGSMPKLDRLLARVQNDLFDLGSDLATPGADPAGAPPSLRITAQQTEWIEEQIDHYNEGLKPLTSFVLPGGTPLAVALHLGRTVTRRAERLVVELIAAEPDVNNAVMVYLNRLSDLLFVMARVANANGDSDVLWAPGKFGHEGQSRG